MVLKYKFLTWTFTFLLCFVVQASHSLPTHLEDTYLPTDKSYLQLVFWLKQKIKIKPPKKTKPKKSKI